jgi:pimeloyl-ACP methyl ester carboxylesterase
VGLVRPAAPPAPFLLFFGGNAMGLSSCQEVLALSSGDAPWGLAAFAYRGYDGSGGRPTEAGLLADAEAIAAWLERTHDAPPARLVVMGQSLGTGIAAHLAAHLARRGTPAAGLVLLSPFMSMARVFAEQVPLVPIGWAAPDPYRTDRLAPDLPAPVLLIHGTDDALIRPAHGRELAALLGSRGRLLELAGREHNDLWSDRRTVAAIRGLVAAH